MPQDSLLYAVGRLRMLRRSLLSPVQIQRLVSAADYAEAISLLKEAGYLPQELQDAEQTSVNRLQEAAQTLRRLSPDPNTTDAFLLRYDVHNLKVLLKARILGIAPEGLSLGGTLDPEMLRHAVAEHSYRALPPELAGTMQALEKRVATQADPMEIDVRLDQALYRLMAEKMRRKAEPVVKGWLRMKADFVNLRAWLRLKRMTIGLPLHEVLLEGGDISHKLIMGAEQQPELLLHRATHLYGSALGQLLRQALEDPAQLTTLERFMEDRLLHYFDQQALRADSIGSVLQYLLSTEQESAAVRLILAGKRAGLTEDEIEERLGAR